MKTSYTIAILLSSLTLFSGCLETRESQRETDEKQVMQKTVKTLQQTNADVNSRFQDLEDDSRKMTGRLEAVEYKLNQMNQKAEKGDQGTSAQVQQLNAKLGSYQEALSKLDQQVADLTAQVAELRAARAAGGGAARSAGTAGKEDNPYTIAEELFAQKQWKDAILEYEKYRKQYPKGKSFADSTYKIGVCFQELGLADDARAFYEEVVAKAPKSAEANRARTRLKNLKKK